MSKKIHRFFSCHPPFDELKAAALKRLESETILKEYSKTETVFTAGEPADYLFTLVKGRVDLQYTSTLGHVVSSCIVYPGEFFCCLPFLDEGSYPSTAVCASRCVILKTPVRTMRGIAGEVPLFLNAMTRLCAAKLRRIDGRNMQVFEPAEKRVARMLVELEQRLGSEIEITRSEVAQLCAMAPETAIRIVSSLQKRGIIGGHRGVIRILNLGLLKRMSS
ncbi:MAG: Crp/Fnr family transcriptional regulator [Candidatus Omnitrophica bacterium]|nr:Crp/Fnr family transcriptional regulator [Candidatus Omnitrophota bacterium]